MEGKNIEIKINPLRDLDGNERQLSLDYWNNVFNGRTVEFVNSLSDLAESKGLTNRSFTNLVKGLSNATVYSDCDCGNRKEKTVTSRSDLVYEVRDIFRWGSRPCPQCIEKEIENKRLVKQQEYEAYQKEVKRLETKRRLAFESKAWEELNGKEMIILKKILIIRSLDELWGFVFNGNAYDKGVWQAVNRIESLGLITIERGYKGRIRAIQYCLDLKAVLIESPVEFPYNELT